MADTEEKLTLREQVALMKIAREAIGAQLTRSTPATFPPQQGALDRPSGAFVSLHQEGRLRGCIGALSADEPLYKTVAEMSVQAASHDPRFSPLTKKELALTEIEVSVLGPLTPIAPEDVKVGEHGLFIHRDRYRGVLLPQVATQYGWTREQFLSETCRKAGLPPDAWQEEGTYILAFTAQVVSEDELMEAGHIK